MYIYIYIVIRVVMSNLFFEKSAMDTRLHMRLKIYHHHVFKEEYSVRQQRMRLLSSR